MFNPAAGSAALRELNVIRAVQDALRYLWVSQSNRAGNFPAGITTNWGSLDFGYVGPAAALVVLAFENHGYRLPNNNSAPTGLYRKMSFAAG